MMALAQNTGYLFRCSTATDTTYLGIYRSRTGSTGYFTGYPNIAAGAADKAGKHNYYQVLLALRELCLATHYLPTVKGTESRQHPRISNSGASSAYHLLNVTLFLDTWDQSA